METLAALLYGALFWNSYIGTLGIPNGPGEPCVESLGIPRDPRVPLLESLQVSILPFLESPTIEIQGPSGFLFGFLLVD